MSVSTSAICGFYPRAWSPPQVSILRLSAASSFNCNALVLVLSKAVLGIEFCNATNARFDYDQPDVDSRFGDIHPGA